jgi:argininosuccinate lyase
MYAKRAALELVEGTVSLRRVLIDLAEEHLGVVVPGYTHLQRAQPVLLSHHLLAYSWMLSRDTTRLRNAYESADVLPLGSAALAGTSYPLDREYVATRLGFSAVSPNSLDAVSDRDFLLDLVHACAVCQTHLSRLAEEIVIWSSAEFGFVTLDDAFSTGSSIMPQKKNPDFAELVRGKTGRVYGDLQTLLVMMKGLPLAYNKDMQEDKEPTFDAIDTVAMSLGAMEGMLSTLTVNAEVMRAASHGGHMLATDVADYLVGKGVPFREAHEIVGRLVLSCERDGRTLQELTAEDYAEHSAVFGADVLEVVDVDRAVGRRSTVGGTGHDAVRDQLASAKDALQADIVWAESVAE